MALTSTGLADPSRRLLRAPGRSACFTAILTVMKRCANELETHLKLLQRQGLIDAWHDRRITGGDEWKGRIDENLEQADIILLLVSADFIASDYCYDVEMNRALERHHSGDAVSIPVVVRDVNRKSAPFARL